MAKKILITSALPYANGPLHFGHIAGAYLPADCFARYHRLLKDDVLYICGSDEHGVAITLSAQLAGRSPREHVDHFHKVIQDFFSQLNISFDFYSRTTWEGHVLTTQEFFRDLLKNGYIEEKITPQLYSENENLFLADRYVIGTCPRCGFDSARGDECQSCGASYEATELIKPRSKVSGAPLVLRSTKHWFLLCNKFKQQLKNWIAKKNWKPNVIKFALRYIDELRPRAITRDSDWGIPVPLEQAQGKVFYVWFDAPIGYISATRDWAENQGDPDKWKEYWCDPETRYVQFIGKDNIPFHAIFFPAMMMGQDQPYKMVDDLPANEFLNLEGRQFSKSEGWYIDLDRFFSKFTADQIRYALAANAPETQDAEFTWKDFQMRCNAELLGKYGNLVNRVLVFAANQCEETVPSLENLSEVDRNFLSSVDQQVKTIGQFYATFQLRRACQQLMELAHLGNTYFNDKKPWEAAKDPDRKTEIQTTIACCLYCLKALALTSYPIIPETAEKVWKMLGYESTLIEQQWDQIATEPVFAGQRLPKPSVLFAKVEDHVIEEELGLLGDLKKSQEKKSYVPLKKNISIDEVDQLDLRVGQIKSAERIPKSKKLLKLQVDIGFDERTIVAGIGQSIENPEDLVGRKVAVIANLKPAKLMGVESQGMLLASSLEKGHELPHFEDANPGDVIS